MYATSCVHMHATVSLSLSRPLPATPSRSLYTWIRVSARVWISASLKNNENVV